MGCYEYKKPVQRDKTVFNVKPNHDGGGPRPLPYLNMSVQIQKSILMLTVYYEELSYTYISEEPEITFETLLGLTGGQFGLLMVSFEICAIFLFQIKWQI